MRKNLVFTASLLSIVILSITGCQKTDKDTTGRLIVNITDAPFPIDMIEEASVTVTKVEVRNDAESDEHPFITIFEGSKEFNLLELRNGVMEELVDVEIPAGSYNLIRIYVENAGIVVKDHESYSVKVPSGSQTGIKMFVQPSLQVQGGLTSEVILDFNLDKSFVLKGNMDSPAGIKGFNFKPVIRAINKTIAGTIAGRVTDADGSNLPGVTVSIMLDELMTTQTEEDGSYALSGIPSGIYSITAEKEGFTSVIIDEIEVVAGNKTVQDFVLEEQVTQNE
jgi:hypothetical protein